MVKIIRSNPSFPRGFPGIRTNYPFWDEVAEFTGKDVEGIYRGDFLYFRYNSRVEQDKKINNNPLILFEGMDSKGNIMGVNLMFYNMYIYTDPITGKTKKEINTTKLSMLFSLIRTKWWDQIYQTGERKAYMPFFKQNFKTFGPHAIDLDKYWRKYNIKKMSNLSNLPIDAAEEILSGTKPTFVKSMLKIR